jgi:hypothetical protein
MAAIARRGLLCKIPASTVLATADDLDGTTDNTQVLDATGLLRVLYVQHNSGTAGTAGIDVIEVSKDGGTTWAADATLLALASDDNTGTSLVGIMNAAGVEPVNVAIFKGGPYEGPTKIRCGRKTTDTSGTTWITGAPAVFAISVGD